MNTSVAASAAPTLRSSWRADVTSGFMVFLLALPLCLGISMASGFPPFAGIVTAVVGGVAGTFLGSAPLTIKGPAAGLIVIVLGAVEELGGGNPLLGYHATLGVVVVSGALLAALGALRAGRLSDFFPASAVHGMLAAIGVIIIAKQAHVVLGVTPTGHSALELLAEIPSSLAEANPGIAVIGVGSLAILALFPKLSARGPRALAALPPALVVLVIAMALGRVLDLDHTHRVEGWGLAFDLGPSFLVAVPERLDQLVAFPSFGAMTTLAFWKWVLLFTLVGGLESLLSTKAVDGLDPRGRTADANRDLFAMGASNVLAGCLGGLPMISEIVRSSANVASGAQSRWSNFFHGVFLFAFVAFLPGLVHAIPLAALAALLVHTGARLAHPRAFLHAREIGPEQAAIFTSTLAVTLATDLLVGMAAGIGLKMVLHALQGVALKRLLSARVERQEGPDAVTLVVHDAIVFSNYLGFARHLDAIPRDRTVRIDLSPLRLLDHSSLEHLQRSRIERERAGGSLELVRGDHLQPVSRHPLATRRARPTRHAA